MYYEIERDEEGWPLRMWLRNGREKVSEQEKQRRRLLYLNSLPMPAMRDWARDHGLIA
jgi:hypothetical protein